MSKIAILGFGVVGSGVAEVLHQNGTHIDAKIHSSLDLKYILTRRDYPDSPFASLIIHDFSTIENDPEVDIIVETIGGIGAAKDYTQRALTAGKSVVTANKELVAKYGYELMKLAADNNVSYLYEASVGGGIPIIRPLKQCLAANEISKISGILNGTTNYILTQMVQAGVSFDTALKAAQENGYAEADPTADIDGHDTCRKICILASLAFGKHIYPEQVSTEGIRNITLDDIAYAESCGYKIKLLGRAIRDENGNISAFVSPHLVSSNDPLAGVEDVFNAITVRGNAIGDVMFYGRGAGKLPTASAVVADVMEVARNKNRSKYLDWEQGSRDIALSPTHILSSWYVRAKADSNTLRTALGNVTVLSSPGTSGEETAVLTPFMTCEDLKKRLSAFRVAAVFRVLDSDS